MRVRVEYARIPHGRDRGGGRSAGTCLYGMEWRGLLCRFPGWCQWNWSPPPSFLRDALSGSPLDQPLPGPACASSSWAWRTGHCFSLGLILPPVLHQLCCAVGTVGSLSRGCGDRGSPPLPTRMTNCPAPPLHTADRPGGLGGPSLLCTCSLLSRRQQQGPHSLPGLPHGRQHLTWGQ